MPDITDTPYPIWTEVVNSSTTAAPGGSSAGGRTRDDSLAALSEIIGWRINKNDPAGIRRALDEAFSIRRLDDGRTVVDWIQHGMRVQIGQSGENKISGAQQSILVRARTIVDQAKSLLAGLQPLRTEPDWEDVDAIRMLVDRELDQLVEQLGAEGGPVPQIVDHLLDLLVDYDPAQGSGTFTDPATVGGQLGLLRRRFGFVLDNVNTRVEEERLTQFHTLVNYVDMLKMTWHAQRDFFDRVDSEAFLGTHSVLIERALTCVTGSVHEVYQACNSVFFGPEERAVLLIDFFRTTGGAQTTLFSITSFDAAQPITFANGAGAELIARVTFAELLDWIQRTASAEGFDLLRAGKDAITLSLAPTLARQAAMLTEAIAFLGSDPSVPNAVTTLRVTTALRELESHVRNAAALTGQIQRFTAPKIESVEHQSQVIWDDDVVPGPTPVTFSIDQDVVLKIRGDHFQQDAVVALTSEGRAPLLPIRTVWDNDSKLKATFHFDAQHLGNWKLRVLNGEGSDVMTPTDVLRVQQGTAIPFDPNPNPSTT